jgi:glyoxylase-like metal-dependent hydrolase (beta-lactamase superfamily II)
LENHSIIPLRVAELEIFKATQTFYADFDKKIWSSIYVWYIKGASKNILVDTGEVTPDASGMVRSSVGAARVRGGGPDSVRAALQRVNLTPADIDVLILTHLHRDHAANIGLFKRATLVIQKAEVEYAREPLPPQRLMYLPELISKVNEAHEVKMLDGDFEIEKGVTLYLAPGHTPGLQMVGVQTQRGLVVMCSDAAPLYHNLFPSDARYGTPQPHLKLIPPGIMYDFRQWYASMERISGIANMLIPGHEPEISKLSEIP